MDAVEGGNSGAIMLIASPENTRTPPLPDFPLVLGNDRESPHWAPECAAPKVGDSNECRPGRSHSADGKGLSRDDFIQKTANDKTDSPLLSNAHRRTISNYSGDIHCDDRPHSPLGESSFFGPGGLLAPRRVQVLLLLQCLVAVSM